MKVPIMKEASHRPVYMVFQKSAAMRTCGCPKGVMCGKCKSFALASFETIVDGYIARLNPKKKTVNVQSPPKILRYRSGVPTGETVPGEKVSMSYSEFCRTYSPGFRKLCEAGWIKSFNEVQEKKGK